MFCCVVDCPNKLNNSLRSHSYPFPRTNYKSQSLKELSQKRRNAWIRSLRIISAKNEVLDNQKVCFRHFLKGRPSKLADEKNPDWVPKLHLGTGANRICEIAQNRNPTGPRNNAKVLQSNSSGAIEESLEISDNESFSGDGNDYDEPDIEFVPVSSAPEVHSVILNTAANNSPQSNVKTMIINSPETTSMKLRDKRLNTDHKNVFVRETNQPANNVNKGTSKSCDIALKIQLKNKDELIKMYQLREKEIEVQHNKQIDSYVVRVRECDLELKKLRSKLRLRDISFNGLKNDNEKVKTLTGMPNFETVTQLFDVVKDHLHEETKAKINAFDGFIITLMKLRLDLSISYLSYIFGVTNLTISRIYRENLATMNANIGPLVKWPDDETLLLNTPSCFKEIMGDKCIVLIHFLEILIKNLKPANKGVQYMKHKIRYLIAFSPAGEIIFVSQGFGSSATNEGIIEESGFFDKISEHHIVLSVKDMFEESQKDDEQIQSIKHMAKNTEDKVLDLLKDNFKILFNRQPVNSNAEVYSEFTVRCCCALANIQMPESWVISSKETTETVVVHTKPVDKKEKIVAEAKESDEDIL